MRVTICADVEYDLYSFPSRTLLREFVRQQVIRLKYYMRKVAIYIMMRNLKKEELVSVPLERGNELQLLMKLCIRLPVQM